MSEPALEGVSVFERGWLSSNNVLLHGAPGEAAVLVDSGHCLHAAQTVALVRAAMPPHATLGTLVNTHLHSDHCGGNAALVRAFGVRTLIPPGEAAAVAAWDEAALSYRATGQRIERFGFDAVLHPGESVAVGGRRWEALGAPGHDPHSLILFDAQHGVVISADALWENGFGVVFPELDGEDAFDDVAAVLDLIEHLRPVLVIPGHGAPFGDVAGALERARRRLAAFQADPARHARYGAKVLLKYHLLEERAQDWPALQAWFEATPLAVRIWQRLGRPGGTLAAWLDELVAELCAGGALAQRDGRVSDA
ncbi:MAG TPA: MBL fold metallo-hydrolase [Burkholderiaceae bacterium]|nr:MBL fold metallo-hydrolase [Burkholderiaceae bacterium]